MTGTFDVSPMERPITRLDIETSIGLAWNAAGEKIGLPPLAWRLGDPGDGIHFVGVADAYAPELRCEIVELWIAILGLADHIDFLNDPLRQEGTEMIWTGALDGVMFQFSYPAAPEGDPRGQAPERHSG